MHANEQDSPRHETAVAERRGSRDKQPHAERRLQAHKRHSQQERDSLRQLQDFVRTGSAWR